MRKRIFILFLVTFSLFLSGCDEINQLMTLVPKFETDLPNVFSGKFAYYADENYESMKQYDELYEFDPIEKTFTYMDTETSTENPKTGSYTYSYIDFIITECNGYLNLYFDDDTTQVYGFRYEATATGGPVSITLRQNSRDKVFVFEP